MTLFSKLKLEDIYDDIKLNEAALERLKGLDSKSFPEDLNDI